MSAPRIWQDGPTSRNGHCQFDSVVFWQVGLPDPTCHGIRMLVVCGVRPNVNYEKPGNWELQASPKGARGVNDELGCGIILITLLLRFKIWLYGRALTATLNELMYQQNNNL